jgi:hypothetical protein
MRSKDQETGIRRIIRTFDPDVPGYVFWVVMLALISFTNWSYTSGSASRVQPLRRNPDTETNSGRTPLSSGFASHDCPPLVRPASSRHEVFLLSPALAGLFLEPLDFPDTQPNRGRHCWGNGLPVSWPPELASCHLWCRLDATTGKPPCASARIAWRPRRGQGAISEELGCLEDVGEAGRAALTSLSPLAALPNRRRFFVDFLRGVTPFRRGRYRFWRNICERNGGGGNDSSAAWVIPAPNLRRRNAAALCASSPRRAAV